MARKKDDDDNAVDGGFVVPIRPSEGTLPDFLASLDARAKSSWSDNDADEPPPESGTRRTFRTGRSP